MPDHLEGVMPIPGRLEPWMATALSDHAALERLVEEHGSPVNLVDTRAFAHHVDELTEVGTRRGLPVRVHFARKANKALGFVEAAFAAGAGVDVSSLRELQQVLAVAARYDADPRRIILTAAVKPRRLLRAAVAAGVVISVDNDDELDALLEIAGEGAGHEGAGDEGEPGHEVTATHRPAAVPVALRVQARLTDRPVSRFGFDQERVRALLVDPPGDGAIAISGLHIHLDGYRWADRATMLRAAIELADQARAAAGAVVEFIDIGGGVPMSYVDEPAAWQAFLDSHGAAVQGIEHGDVDLDTMTWQQRPLGHTYPLWQQETRGDWLALVLDAPLQADADAGPSIAQALDDRGIALHLEPGRSLLDGCGMTVARVEFRKRLPSGDLLVGAAMNRTQCRSAADDFLLDPVLVPAPSRPRSPSGEGFLVGAYCIENELLTWRRLRFPEGVAVGDLVAFVNTAGYLMHILESASHQIPLARNLIRSSPGDGHTRWEVDQIDRS